MENRPSNNVNIPLRKSSWQGANLKNTNAERWTLKKPAAILIVAIIICRFGPDIATFFTGLNP